MIPREKLLERAASQKGESKYLEFKVDFDVDSTRAWCEVIKDIVAMANTDGGIIVFGVEDSGELSGSDVSAVAEIDPADIVNRIARYTNFQLSEVEVVQVERDEVELPALLIAPAEVPLIFRKPGAYDPGDGSQKFAFREGTIYFRHGAKSEGGNRDDLLRWRDYQIEHARKTWMTGIRKVVESSPDEVIRVLTEPSQGGVVRAQLVDDPNALRVQIDNVEERWPFRQKELITEVNANLNVEPQINSHDILCVNKSINVLADRIDFAYKAHRHAAVLYSREYADWIVRQFQNDPEYFRNLRQLHKEKRL